jgi:hybrid cluster-associated redox disulfide protein
MRITKDLTIFETIRSHPKATDVLKLYNMSCSGCMAVMDESIELGARRHGTDLEELLRDLNALFNDNSGREPDDKRNGQ